MNASISGGNQVLDDIVTVYASVASKSIQNKTTYLQMTGSGVNITSGSEYGLQLTLESKATITITATAKKSAGPWALKNSKGTTDSSTNAVLLSDDPTKDTPTEITFENVAAGTYMLGAKSNGGNLYSLTITYSE